MNSLWFVKDFPESVQRFVRYCSVMSRGFPKRFSEISKISEMFRDCSEIVVRFPKVSEMFQRSFKDVSEVSKSVQRFAKDDQTCFKGCLTKDQTKYTSSYKTHQLSLWFMVFLKMVLIYHCKTRHFWDMVFNTHCFYNSKLMQISETLCFTMETWLPDQKQGYPSLRGSRFSLSIVKACYAWVNLPL